jgi:hypothetical protein
VATAEGAADAAATRLAELATLLDEAIHLRRSRHGRLDGWVGARREEFDVAVADHQRDAAEVAERCRATAARIRRAAAAARQAALARQTLTGQAPMAW